MKRISSRFAVAVHILSFLAASPEPCTSEWVAQSVDTNPVVVRKCIGLLKRAGLVHVRAGAGGAYLQKEPGEITLLEVLRAVEAVEANDLFRLHEHPNPSCPVGANIHAVLGVILHQAQSAMESVLANVTIKQLVEELGEKISSTRS